MIKWGRNIIDIVGGDLKKREALIVPRYFIDKDEILVGWEMLQADEGLIEIIKAIKKANGGE